ncbi:hypothetical protein COP2_003947 [Malus domestica]
MVVVSVAVVTVLAASGKTSSIPNFQVSKFGYLPVNKFFMEFFMQKVGAYMKLNKWVMMNQDTRRLQKVTDDVREDWKST